jgi:ligand-binding sensor domain-containing protein/nitrate/nitrite-specific signal transduction histidine kinase
VADMLAHHTPKRKYRVPRRAVLLLIGITALFGSTLALAAPAWNPPSHYLCGEACGNGTTSPGAGRADSAEEGARTTTPPVAASQDPQTPENLPPPSIRFERISIAEGLSFSKVDAILQDRQGFLWFGTERGLNKYDGYQFTVYRNDPGDPRSLSHDRIYALYEDSAGELWVGTAVGLDRLDRATGTFVHYQAGLGGNPFTGMPGTGASVFAIWEDRNGVLWVGGGGGLYQLEPDSQAPIRSPAWEQVGEIAENIDGQLWVADVDGLYLYDPETDQRSPVGLGVQSISVIYVDPRGDVWMGASDGLRRMDHSTGSVVHYEHDPEDSTSLGDDRVYALLEDRAGRLWVGTSGGLDLFDREQNRFVHYRYDPSDPYSLSDDQVTSLYEDFSGVLWIGTTRGLSKYSWAANRFTLYTRLPACAPGAMAAATGQPLEISGLQGLSSDRVWAVHEDHTGNLWAGMFDAGLNRLDRATGTLTVYRYDPADPNSLSNDTVREIYEDRSGALWVSTDGGLDQFEPGSGAFLKDWGLGINEVVWAITEDRAGGLWIGTLADLYAFDRQSGRFTPYQKPGWSPVAVRSLYADETGLLWVGTQGAGLYRWDGTRFTSYQPQTSNPYNAAGTFIRSIFTSLAVDSGAVWVGTDWSGLLRFDRAAPGGEFQRYTEKDGLVGNRVQCILADADGFLWLATNRGVSRFDPATQVFRNYDARDGLYNGETWDCFQSSRGEMFIGGLGGLAAFFPGQIKDNAQPPPIAITAFRLLNQAEPIVIPPNGRIELSYQQNDLSIEFAALDYHAPDKNQYAYRMEGVDRDWVSAGTRRYVNYTNLQPGNYVFRVKGSNNDGVWNEEGVTLHITIRPPFWGTWLFRGLVAVLLVGTALGAYRLRVRSIEARSQELENQVKERTGEINQRRKELEALYQADENLYRHLNLEQVLQALIDTAIELLNADKGSMLCWDDKKENLVIRAARNFQSQTITNTRIPRGKGKAGKVAQSGVTAIVEDTAQDASVTQSIIQTENIRAFIQVPIKVENEVFGVFSADYTSPRSFKEDEIRLLQALAQRAGIAIQNARLYEQSHRLAVLEERSRLARELHDAVTQTLFSASLVAEALPAAWEKDPQEGHGLLQDLRGLSRGALAEMRTLLLELRPAALLETRLDDLLHQLGEAASGREGIPVTVQIEGETELHQGVLPPDVHIALYRIAQEALNNVIKHARAHQATVRLCYNPGDQIEPLRVSLSISDDGRGFDPAQLQHNRLGFGIMQERVQAISGTLTIESQPGHGTRVTVLWKQAKRLEAT